MKIATLLFTYNRSNYIKQVLDSLKNNVLLPQKLIVFQDGLRQYDDSEWNKVNELIRSIDWCNKEIIVSEYHKGPANSIISGIDYAFKEYDAVIVLEDDCVPAPGFISYMVQCFEKYKNQNNVYSVSGYSWPIKMQKSLYDIYGCGRTSYWGWGTWKDRWNIYQRNYELIADAKEDKNLSRKLALWGRDLENALMGNIQGRTDAWGVFWALGVILQGGICINPYKSLINDIGMDGSDVHCGVTDEFNIELDESAETFKLPDEISILKETEIAFANLYGSYTVVNESDKNKENVLVYGIGHFFKRNEKQINYDYNINKFVDGYKKGYYAGKQIIKPDEIDKYAYDKILIMIQDVQVCIDVIRKLLEYGIDYKKIILGISLYGGINKLFDSIIVTADGKLQLCDVGGITLRINSKDEFANVYEVLVSETYNYSINNDKKDIVFDIGMNVGDSALYFAAKPKVKKVYAYEPFKETYKAAMDNFNINMHLKNKIESFQYGLSNVNSKREIKYNENMTCGQSTLSDMRKISYDMHKAMGLINDEQEKEEIVEVCDAAKIIGPIIKEYKDCNIVLKMDCEGEEYRIMERLSQEKLLDNILFVMMEWHHGGNESLIRYLVDAGFSYWCYDCQNGKGYIYAYKYNV